MHDVQQETILEDLISLFVYNKFWKRSLFCLGVGCNIM